ncbi:type II toxin-antitoxin system VapC family toxin [Rhizobium sp. LjRoot254]|uniref:type II toxin-antitoxin system VapC family toxin n=1 Tax=Rhizobium sp. LjRoot254 TaxID=3342297 RepID=UPI003ED0ED6A
MIVVDTSVWIDWIWRRQTDGATKLELLINKDIIALGDIVLLEVLQGARDDLHAKRLQDTLARYRPVTMLDNRIAIKAASNYRHLRAMGVTIRTTPDLIIGTWCIESDVPLLHSDRDFIPMVEHLGLRQL